MADRDAAAPAPVACCQPAPAEVCTPSPCTWPDTDCYDNGPRAAARCESVYPPSASGPYSDECGWSGPLRCVLSHAQPGDNLHANSGIFWREGEVESDTIRDTLIDCMTSFGIHGDAAREAADYILSPSSGLSVTQAEASDPQNTAQASADTTPAPPQPATATTPTEAHV